MDPVITVTAMYAAAVVVVIIGSLGLYQAMEENNDDE